MSENHPYVVEYARSARSKCRGCSENIDYGLLRIGVNIQLSYWFHKDCFFKRHKPGKPDDISNFKKLRKDDQAYIRANIGTEQDTQNAPEEQDENAPPTEEKKEKSQTARRKPKAVVGGRSKFMVDYSLSSKATCCSCHEKIEKSVVRIARMDYTSNKGKALNGIPRWYHVQCFVSNRDFFEFWDGADALPGFFALAAKDQQELKNVLSELTVDKVTEQGAGNWKKEKIEAHTFQKLKTFLETLNMKDLESILKHNKQIVPKQKRKKDLLDSVCTLARFGVIGKCPNCNTFSIKNPHGNFFSCEAEAGQEACGFETTEPPRTELKIPKKLRDEFELLRNYDFKIQEKILNDPKLVVPTSQLNVNAQEFVPGPPKQQLPRGPLYGMEFAIIGADGAKEMIKRLGGMVVMFINEKTKAIISDEESMEAARNCKNKRLNYAEQHMTPIVDMEFLEHVERFGTKNLKKVLKEMDMAGEWLFGIDDDFMNDKYGPFGRNYW